MDEDHGQILEGWRHEVFLSFHGDDTRKNFTDHLYHALRDSGINTFRDDEELPRGGVISSELQEAIKSSKVLVIVFSKNYASSTWCLDELLHIMKCSESKSQQLAFPIFLDIDPSDIRKQKRTVAESLAKHERHFQSDKVQSWRDALRAAANLSGWDLRDKYEAECIKDIVREIIIKLDPSLPLSPHPVGLDPRALAIDELLSIDSEDVRVVGIYGMGGIGKTMIAKAVYNKFSKIFDGKSFLENIREHYKKPEGKIRVVQKLLSDVLNRRAKEFKDIHRVAKEILRQRRVLVVLDDVEDLEQFNSVDIQLSWFGLGSRIIVTTRNMHLLNQLGAKSYTPPTLNADEALELLSWHAFRTTEPPEGFLWVSRELVRYCGGLPLAVEVLGASLFKRQQLSYWTSTLELLKKTPDDKIQKSLRISFDSLEKVQKDIFLDTACFFIEMDKDYVTYILDGCGFYPCKGLNDLMERCLVAEDGNKLMMHHLIGDMGREIVKNESLNSFGKRSRFWDSDDAIDVLMNYSGKDAVEGLSLKARSLDAQSLSGFLKLRLLKLKDVQIRGSYEHFPKRLRWLCWHSFPLEFVKTQGRTNPWKL